MSWLQRFVPKVPVLYQKLSTVKMKVLVISPCAQVTVFMLVCVLTLIVASPDSRYSKAGLYAIFATQSNDFALGYPIGKTNT